jgi:hypothetical protein
MTKQDDQRIAALAKKNAAKAKAPVKDRAAQYDDTLKSKPPEDDHDTKRFFKDMKKREF